MHRVGKQHSLQASCSPAKENHSRQVDRGIYESQVVDVEAKAKLRNGEGGRGGGETMMATDRDT